MYLAFVSCVSPTLFQPVGSGSHLYSAHRNTMRSRTLSARTYSLSWAPTFCGCLASLICVLIITQLRWFVKTLFDFFQKDFFNLYCTLTSLCTRQGFVASFTSHLGCVALIVSQLGRFVKGFLVHFFFVFTLDYCSALSCGIPTLRWLYRVSPLDTIIIPHPEADCKME